MLVFFLMLDIGASVCANKYIISIFLFSNPR